MQKSLNYNKQAAKRLISDQEKKYFEMDAISRNWHEASHCVIALFNFFKVLHISVIPNEEQDGITNYLSSDGEYDNGGILKLFAKYETQVYYAGYIGERIFYQDLSGSHKLPLYFKIGSSFDFDQASKLIRKYELAETGNPTTKFKKQTQAYVRKILIEHWDAVKLVSHALYQKKRLSYDDIKKLLRFKTSSEHKKFWKKRFKQIDYLYKQETVLPENLLLSIIQDDKLPKSK